MAIAFNFNSNICLIDDKGVVHPGSIVIKSKSNTTELPFVQIKAEGYRLIEK